MRKIFHTCLGVVLFVVCALGTSILSAGVAAAQEGPHFGYTCEDCPASWGNLDESFSTCSEGTSQSPVAFDTATAVKEQLPALDPQFGPSTLEVERLAVNFEAFVEPDSNFTFVGDKRFDLVQFHFHSKAEHVVNGERSPLELHFVHRADDGALAVIGVFIEEGAHFAPFDPLIEVLPEVAMLAEGGHIEVHAVDVANLLPDSLRSFRYSGSTTTPPCVEPVNWILLDRTIQLSAEQIAAIQQTIRGFNSGFDNNRPIQELNGRIILVDDDGDGSGGCTIAAGSVNLGTAMAGIFLPLSAIAFAFGLRIIRNRRKRQ